MELALSILVIAACTCLVGLLRQAADVASLLSLFTLEFILPLALGLVASGLLAGDPAIEMLLTNQQPAWRVMLGRLLVLLVISAVLATVLLALSNRWQVPVPKQSPDNLFIWLSPLAACMGLGSAAALWRGRALDGVMAVTVLMGGSLMLLPQVPRACAGNVSPDSAMWLASPLMTLGRPDDGFWALNRVVWLGAGVGMVVLSLFLARREEVLFGRPEDG